MNILSNIVFFISALCFVACFLCVVLLQLANSQLLTLIYLMFMFAFALFINYKLSTLKN